jgi:hypothetical protein
LPQDRKTARVDFEGADFYEAAQLARDQLTDQGRFENMDTLVLIVADRTDERNIDQDQVKIVDTVVKFTVQPSKVQYGCGAGCQNIVVTIEDPDENLNCNEIEYVPVFVIINPGSWNPTQSESQTFPNNFCSLMMYGGHTREEQEQPLQRADPLVQHLRARAVHRLQQRSVVEQRLGHWLP